MNRSLREGNSKLLRMHNEIVDCSSSNVTPKVKFDALVLEARLRQSLTTVRSLGSKGLRVAAMETFDGLPTFWSRWCQQAIVCPTDGRANIYLTCLEKAIERTAASVLIVSSDANVELIRRHREQLEKRVYIALAKEPALGIASNKEQTLEVARRLGLGIPRAVTLGTLNEVSTALREIGLPAVIKPTQPWIWTADGGVGVKGKLVTTLDEALHVVDEFTSLGTTVLFQQFLPGRREAISLLYAQGQIYACFAQWAKRMAPPLGGTSVLRQSISIPQDIGEQAERLVREIELEGYSEVEYRRDSAGKPYLMEINPRLSASVEIAVRAGVDFPYLLYQWAIGGRIPIVKGYRVGLWMRYLRGDLAAMIRGVQESGRPGVNSPTRTVFDFCTSFLFPMRYDYFDWKDPAPAGVASIDFVRYASYLLTTRLIKRRNQ